MDGSPQSAPQLDLGGCRVTLVRGGSLRLDGGAMFGIIPKPLWSRPMKPDPENRILLACNCLLVEWTRPTDRRVIIETGHGPKYRDKEARIFAIDPNQWLLPALGALGIDPATITDVILSHLHFDHAGGLTFEQDGRLVPTFPNARVAVQRREFEDARANFGIMTMTYREENFAPIDQADRWNLLEGEAPILEDIRPLLTPGHTRGHQSLLIQGSDRAALFVGDVMPTRHHVGRAYNMGYDLFPVDNRDSKARLLKTAAERDWLLVLDHEPDSPLLRVVPDGEWYTLVRAC